MGKFEFKSQICTTIEQSKRLIALGIKAETADCCHYYVVGMDDKDIPEDANYPAWSLHRLIELTEVSVEISGLWIKISGAYRYEEKDNVYDNLIDAIKELIDNNVFNQDYLEDKK